MTWGAPKAVRCGATMIEHMCRGLVDTFQRPRSSQRREVGTAAQGFRRRVDRPASPSPGRNERHTASWNGARETRSSVPQLTVVAECSDLVARQHSNRRPMWSDAYGVCGSRALPCLSFGAQTATREASEVSSRVSAEPLEKSDHRNRLTAPKVVSLA